MAFIYIVLGTLMWSIDTLIRYPLLSVVSSDTMVFIEHFFLVLYFLPIVFIHKLNFKKINSQSFFAFFVIGVIGSAASTLAFTKAFSLINPSLVILLQKLQPLVAISLSTLLLKEKPDRNLFIFGPIAFLGAFLISYPDIAPLFSNSATNITEIKPLILGYALTLFAVLGWGASTVFGKQLSSKSFTESEIMTGRFTFGFCFLFLYCFSQNSLPTGSITIETYFKILSMVIISGLFGMYFYYKGLRLIKAQLASVAELFFPLSAVLINWIFLNKTLLPLQIIGGLILIGASWKLQNTKNI